MPYIAKGLRSKYRIVPENVGLVAGELNYQITTLCLSYLKLHGLSYTRLNEVVGALECAKLELYRRIAAPYEDRKKKENGDVYPDASDLPDWKS